MTPSRWLRRLGAYVAYAGILGVSLAFAIWLERRHPGLPTPARSAAPKVSSSAPGVKALPTVPSSTPPVVASAAPPDVMSEALCPEGMVWVEATACATFSRRCARREGEVCRAFEPASCRPGQKLRFCVDRYEYPNTAGMLPAALVTFAQARTACEAENKRLCTEAEWALSCEGARGLAYPYGDEQDESACNMARKVETLRPEELWEPSGVSAAISRVDQRAASGSFRGCKSPFGVQDLVGNVEEWVSSDAAGFHGALRGGEYSQGDPTCRTVRQLRDPSYRSFHTGFRCCRDPLVRPHQASPGAPARSDGK